jgi:hypothetical protein
MDHVDVAEPPAKVDCGTTLAEERQGRIHEAVAEPTGGHAWTAGRLTAAEGIAHHRPQQPRRSLLGIRIQGSDRQRLPEAPVQDTLGTDALGDRCIGTSARQPQSRQILDDTASRHPAAR